MKEKYNEKYEAQIQDLAGNRLKSKNFKIFDYNARIIKRQNFPELVEQGKTAHQNCLVIINGEGETLVITQEFERSLCATSKRWFEE